MRSNLEIGIYFVLPCMTYRCNFLRSWWVMCSLRRYTLQLPYYSLEAFSFTCVKGNKELNNYLKALNQSRILSLIWLWLQLGDYEVAWVDAEVGKTEGGMLSLLPLSTPAPPHKSVFVGDIKMADFKQFLASKGVPVLLFFVFCFHKWLLQR